MVGAGRDIHDHSAARVEMNTRRLIGFRHDSHPGNAAAHRLFERVPVRGVHDGEECELGERRVQYLPPARSY